MGLRSALKAFFQTGDKPTAAQYAEVIDSLAHTTEDFDKMGGGLKEHVTTRPYKAGEAILVAGKIRTSNFDQTGAYNAANWTDYIGDVKSLGIPVWDPEEEITEPVQRTHRNAIYEAIEESSGIEPGVDPNWETYWVAVVYTEGGIIPVLASGFVKFGTVYEYTGSLAPNGLYRSIAFESGYDGGYKLSISSFATDLAADKWALVAIKEAVNDSGYWEPDFSGFSTASNYKSAYQKVGNRVLFQIRFDCSVTDAGVGLISVPPGLPMALTNELVCSGSWSNRYSTASGVIDAVVEANVGDEGKIAFNIYAIENPTDLEISISGSYELA